MSDNERRYDAKLEADATKMVRESGSSEPGILKLSKEWEKPVIKINPSWSILSELQETREPYSTRSEALNLNVLNNGNSGDNGNSGLRRFRK
jgi:hypothetical protein